MAEKLMGVIDEPIVSKEKDALDIQKHSDALIDLSVNPLLRSQSEFRENGDQERPLFSIQSNKNYQMTLKSSRYGLILGKTRF